MPRPLPISAVLLSTLRQNGVRFAHWKSNLHLAEALAGETDLDLLIDESGARLPRKHEGSSWPTGRQPAVGELSRSRRLVGI
jgi:hypothetical protein